MVLKDLDTVPHHKLSEALVEVLCQKTQNDSKGFFRVMVAYYFSKVASMMRCSINTHDRGILPVNLYAINLATSGSGKGYSMNIIEDKVIDKFRERFLEETFSQIAEREIAKIATRRAASKNTDPDDEIQRVEKEFEALGALPFSFDSGTTAAVKQMRHKLLMSGAGSMNLEIDEIGSNLVSNIEVLNTYLELFDVGKIKQKLTKNTAENVRNEEIHGRTPTNLLLFGTPAKLLNGGKIEEEFYSMLEIGYARRCLFGYGRRQLNHLEKTAEEMYNELTNTNSDQVIEDLSDLFEDLADPLNFNKKLKISKDTTIAYLAYKLDCEKRAEELGEHDEIRKAELSHRYFKALKLAGAYAFVDNSDELTEDHLYSAIKLSEESGQAFQNLLNRESNYAKLAKYIAHIKHDVTQPDLVEQLPFYRGTVAQKSEMMQLAIAYGYKNNIIIRKSYQDGIEFISGETLDQTDLNKVIVSYSNNITSDFAAEEVPFDKLSVLTQQPNMHWVNHKLAEGYRSEDHCIPGFNLLVLDVDGGIKLSTARELLKDFKYHIYTTKRHTEEHNRFRIVMPLSHVLKMDAAEYKEFMQNIYEWLPFEVDSQTGQRARKWLTYDGQYFDNDGEFVDALQFIPRTSKNEERKRKYLDMQSLSNLERWFVNNTGSGNRSNQLIKYALLLVDSGMDINSVKNNVMALNTKLPEKLDEAEIISTIMVTAAKAHRKKQDGYE
tara:strand:- start:51012 stop:53174 length:2163 start_codon:yes stop_codon:yes gene_type:complete